MNPAHLIRAHREGLNIPQLVALLTVADGPVNVCKLAPLIGQSPAAITGTADRLEKLGLAKRQFGVDRRSPAHHHPKRPGGFPAHH